MSSEFVQPVAQIENGATVSRDMREDWGYMLSIDENHMTALFKGARTLVGLGSIGLETGRHTEASTSQVPLISLTAVVHKFHMKPKRDMKMARSIEFIASSKTGEPV